jgi:hypothetical protein
MGQLERRGAETAMDDRDPHRHLDLWLPLGVPRWAARKLRGKQPAERPSGSPTH